MDIDNDTLSKLRLELSKRFEVGSKIRIDKFFTDLICSTDFDLDTMLIVINTSHFIFQFKVSYFDIVNLNSFIGVFNEFLDNQTSDLNHRGRAIIKLLYLDVNNFIKSINGVVIFNGYLITLDEVRSSYLDMIESLVMDESEVNFDLLIINDLYGK